MDDFLSLRYCGCHRYSCDWVQRVISGYGCQHAVLAVRFADSVLLGSATAVWLKQLLPIAIPAVVWAISNGGVCGVVEPRKRASEVACEGAADGGGCHHCTPEVSYARDSCA